MSHNSQSTDTDVSLRNTLNLGMDPPEIELTDVHVRDEQLDRIREVFLASMTDPTAEVRAPVLLLHGPEGAGKIRVARAIANELSSREFECFRYSPTSVDRRENQPYHHSDERLVVRLIEELHETAPALLVIEDYDQIRVRSDGPLYAALNALRTANDRIAVLPVLDWDDQYQGRQHPTPHLKAADLRFHLTGPDGKRCARVLNDALTEITDGTAATVAARVEPPVQPPSGVGISFPRDVAHRAVALAQARADDSPVVTDADVDEAIDQVTAEFDAIAPDTDTAMEQLVEPEVPSVSFANIGGLDDSIQRLQELTTFPQRYPELYAKTPLEPASGVLLYGPPGTGKTLLAKALATDSDRSFFAVEGAAVKSKWFGQSEERLRATFDAARAEAPSVLFFDEFDALAGSRQRISHGTEQSLVNTLLSELDGLSSTEDVVVIAATNYPEAIDDAVKRSGRIGEAIEVPPPDEDGLREIFRIKTKELPLGNEVTPAWFVAEIGVGATGADVDAVIEQAVHHALRAEDERDDVPEITRTNVRHAIEAQVESSEGDDDVGFQ